MSWQEDFSVGCHSCGASMWNTTPRGWVCAYCGVGKTPKGMMQGTEPAVEHPYRSYSAMVSGGAWGCSTSCFEIASTGVVHLTTNRSTRY